MQDSKAITARFETGDPSVSLAEVMINAQKASIQFSGMTEVRNKLLTAYKDVMNMPV
jgi:flagellar hook-basal body complex protein FliE